MATACSKDKTEANASIPSKEIAKQIERTAYQEFASKPESTRNLMFSNAESLLAGQVKKSTGDMELGEAFISIEGIINYNFTEELEMFNQTEAITGEYQMHYYTSEGVNYVDDNEFANVYAEIYNDLNSQLDLSEDLVLLVDMEITELDSINKFIRFVGTAISTAKPIAIELWTPPSQGYYAANLAGPCGANQPGSDVASILQGYVNSYAPWKSRCTNGIQYTVPIATLVTYWLSLNDSYMPLSVSGSTNTWNDVVSHYWKSNTNDCLGNTSQEWTDLAGDINFLRNYGLLRAKANVNSNAEFQLANYHSHFQSSSNQTNSDITENYYHGGSFYYSIITCN